MANEPLKDEIDAQSGRFEFFRQSLTLGLAGLAGTAAFFTDTSKIPKGAWPIGAVIVMGLALLATVGLSLMALSVYANLLKAHATNKNFDGFRQSMIGHAKGIFGSILIVAVAFVVYAGNQLLDRKEAKITGADAVGIARKAITGTGCDATLDTLSPRNKALIATFRSENCHRRYAVEVQKGSGDVSSISSVPTP